MSHLMRIINQKVQGLEKINKKLVWGQNILRLPLEVNNTHDYGYS